jgi:hypothetical protein
MTGIIPIPSDNTQTTVNARARASDLTANITSRNTPLSTCMEDDYAVTG